MKKIKYNERASGIYCIVNKVNNKRYIGKSINLYRRKYQHLGELRRKHHKNEYLQYSYEKYGIDNFEYYIVELCDRINLGRKEHFWIEFFNSNNRKFGYNIDIIDKDGKTIRSWESNNKYKATLLHTPKIMPKGKDNPTSKMVYQYDLDGKFLSEYESCHEAAKAIGKKESYSPIALAARDKLAREQYQWRYDYLPFVDKYTVDRKSIAIQNGKSKSKPIECIDLYNNRSVIYSSVREAAKNLNLRDSCIHRIANGERVKSSKLNMTFKYLN